MDIRSFQIIDSDAVIALWQACDLIRPWNNPQRDIERKFAMNDKGFIVAEMNGEIIASAMFGYDGHRGTVNYLAVAPDYQSQSIGRQMMDYIEATLTVHGCPKINLMVRSGNEQVIAFYKTLGYTIDEVAVLGKRLIED